MPWLVSMRMSGHVIGAPTTTAKRRSVIFSADGSDARLTLDCTSAAAASALASGDSMYVGSRDRTGGCANGSEEVASIELTSDGRFHSGLRWARIISSGHTSASARRSHGPDVRYHPPMLRSQLPSLVILSLAVGAMVLSAQSPPPREQLHALFERTWQWELSESPTTASTLGDLRWNDRWDDVGLAAFERRQAHRQAVLRELAGIPRESLPPADRTHYDVFKYQYAHDSRSLRAPLSSDPDGDLRRRPEHRADRRQPALHVGQGLRGLARAARSVPGVRRPEHRAAARGRPHQHAAAQGHRVEGAAADRGAGHAAAVQERLLQAFHGVSRGRRPPPTARVLPRQGSKPFARASSRPSRRCAPFLEAEYLPACPDRVGWSQTSGGAGQLCLLRAAVHDDDADAARDPRGRPEGGGAHPRRDGSHQDAGGLQRHAGRVLHLPPDRSALLLQDGPRAARGAIARWPSAWTRSW